MTLYVKKVYDSVKNIIQLGRAPRF